jgi:hypothetical protein
MHGVARAVTVLACAIAIRVAPAQSSCNRACLESLAERYLEALVERAPDRLPLTDDVQFTENGQTLEFGSALWATANAVSEYRFYVADTEAQQVALRAVLEENGAPVILLARLGVRDGRIGEVEHLVARPAASATVGLDGLRTPRPIMTAVVPAEMRVPRAALVGIADSYFDGLDELDNGRRVPFHEACQRAENGAEAANAGNAEVGALSGLGCAEQLDTGFSKFVTAIRERRFPVVDEERGLVVAITLYDHAGGIEAVELANGGTFEVPETYRSPSTRLTGQVFRVEGGLIRRIEAVLVDVPYRMPSGW